MEQLGSRTRGNGPPRLNPRDLPSTILRLSATGRKDTSGRPAGVLEVCGRVQRARVSAREIAGVSLVSIAFGLAFSYPLLVRLGGVSNLNDWDLDLQLAWVPYYTVAHYHQFPFWNPYKCGGIAMFANPHSRVLTPFFPLHLLFGPFVGYQLEIPFHIALAWAGGYVLARVLERSTIASAVCATVVAGCSWFYLHASVGHSPMFPIEYLCWVLALMWLSFERKTLLYAIGAAAVVALMLFEGGVYGIPQAFLFVAILVAWRAATERSLFALESLAVFAAFSIGFGAVKLIPAYEVMRMHPRPIDSIDANTILMNLRFLFSRDQNVYPEGVWGPEGSWEYGTYVGIPAAILAPIGIAKSPRKAVPWVIAAVFFFALAMGQASYAWDWLHQLPIMSDERAPSRFLIPFMISLAPLAAAGADLVRQRLQSAGGIVVGTVLALMVADFWVVSVPALVHIVDGRIGVLTPSRVFHQQFIGGDTLPAAMANRGLLFPCYDDTDFETAAIPSGDRYYKGEQYLVGHGSITLLNWTPDEITYQVNLPAPTKAILNQNFDRGWRMVEGSGAVTRSGVLLALELPAGDQRVTIRYRDPYLTVGATGSLLALLAALAVAGLARRRHAIGDHVP